jgi:hypothetical protein
MLALAGALAFGPGGRDVASRMLNDAYDAGQRNKDQVKRDVQQGKDRGQQQAQQVQGQQTQTQVVSPAPGTMPQPGGGATSGGLQS